VGVRINQIWRSKRERLQAHQVALHRCPRAGRRLGLLPPPHCRQQPQHRRHRVHLLPLRPARSHLARHLQLGAQTAVGQPARHKGVYSHALRGLSAGAARSAAAGTTGRRHLPLLGRRPQQPAPGGPGRLSSPHGTPSPSNSTTSWAKA
jgi:hypothetical protein